jgi:hypothetical protein
MKVKSKSATGKGSNAPCVDYSNQCRTFAPNSVERCAMCQNHPGEHSFPVTAERDWAKQSRERWMKLAEKLEKEAAEPKPLTTAIVSGGYANEIIDSLEIALKSFGLHLTPHPSWEGQRDYGFIISNRALTETEIADEQADLEGGQ